MRNLFIAISIFTLAGCAGKPLSMGGTVPADYDVYACAMRELARSDYTIQDTDRPSGFIQAHRQTSGGWSAAVGNTTWDVITVLIFEDAGRQTVRVTASKRDRQKATALSATLYGYDREGKPSDAGLAKAESILANCKPMR